MVLIKKDGTRKEFTLPGKVAVLGRRQDCDFCIPLNLVSRRHCQLDTRHDTLKIRDLGSTNGTLVNGQKVKEAELSAGDLLQIGPLTFGIQIDGQPADIALPGQEATAGGTAKPAQSDNETMRTTPPDTHTDTDLWPDEMDFDRDDNSA